MNWHGYFVVERQNISADNWAALQVVFESMGTLGSRFPCYNNHQRTRVDGDAVIYESRFDTEEVSVAAFKQLLADEFGVPLENIAHQTDTTTYADTETAIWQFLYNDVERFKVERFGAGGSIWQQSGDECRGYLALYRDEWDLEL